MRIILLLLFISVWMAGFALLWSGVRLRRRGNLPHCSRCDYLLTGISADRCPECGALLAGNTIAMGERYRRSRLAWAGGTIVTVCTVLAVGSFTPAVRTYNWYQHWPTSWVVRDLEHNGSAQALAELRRRENGGKISAAQHARLTAFALGEQLKPTYPAITPKIIEYLVEAVEQGKLLPAECERMFEQLIDFKLNARPQVGLGEHFTYQLGYRAPGLPSKWWMEIQTAEMKFAGKTHPGGGSVSFSGGSGGSHGSSVPATSLGKQVLTMKSRVRAYSGVQHMSAQSTLLNDREVVSTIDVEVVNHRPKVSCVEDPASLPGISAAIRADSFKLERYGLSGMIRADSTLPKNAAFELFVRTGGKEYPVGTVAFRRGAPSSSGIHGVAKNAIPPVNQVDLILRSSEQVGFNAIDIQEIWAGEIVIPNVPVALPAKVPAAKSSTLPTTQFVQPY